MNPERPLPHRSITPEPPAEGHPLGLEQDGRAARGTMIGRYFLLRTLGEGGMGIVYAAFDPELDRKIALKLMRETKMDGRDRARQARLLREAQAMAKVSHPNVVAVHDIGTHDGQVFVAMELVEGGTLTDWIEAGTHSVSEIVTAFVEAGKGLVAAHEAGLVHRDFKPENVLVGHDGRVRVTDFGLARLDPVGSDTQPQPVAGSAVKPDGWMKRITQVGALIGTPLYMSPEQSLGLVPDARSDQYSFCASLYWAIFGTVPLGPIDGDPKGSNEPTEDSVSDPGTLQPSKGLTFPQKPRLPARLRRALTRGLAWKPEERYPSMEALLRQLRPDSRALVRRAAAVGAVASVLALAVTLSTTGMFRRDAKPELCGGAPQALAAVWDEAAKGEVLTSLSRSGAPGGADTGARVLDILDRYAKAWTRTRREACEETRLRGEQTEGVLSARMICLDRGLHQMGTLVRLLRSADRAMALKAVDAALDLPSVGTCDAAALSAPPPVPEGARAEVEAVQALLDEVRSLHGTGRFQPALQQATAAAARADATGYWPLKAEALYWKGVLQDKAGTIKLAEQTLRQALLAAERAQSEPERIRAATKLVSLEGWSLARFDEAAFFAQLAEAELLRFPSDELSFNLEMQRALWLTNQRRLEESMAAYRRALALVDRALGPDHPRKGLLLSNLAGVEEELGHHDEAISLLNDALRLITAARGPHHPTAAYAHYNLARALLAKGDYPAAHERAQEAIRIRVAVLGPDHPEVADAMDVLATILQADGLYAEALAQSERALEIKQRALGPEALDLCYSLENVGFAQLSLKAPAKALTPLEQSIALREHAGLQGPDMVQARFALARALWETGRDRRRARALATTAREGALASKNAAAAGAIAGWLASRT